MDRHFVKKKFLRILLILTLQQKCWGEQDPNQHSAYEKQRVYNYQQPSNIQPSYHSHSSYSRPGWEIAHEIGEDKFISEANQANPNMTKTTFDSQRYKVYQPNSQQPLPYLHDPNLVLVPRLGVVRGIHNFKTINNREISAYFGLKYASVRPGLGRFQKASYVKLIENITDATKEPHSCPQFPDLKSIIEREFRSENVDDCLTLNIFTPAKPNSHPVLVFVHGEMLFDGSAAEGQPDYFLENDIVLVTINYRLAPFGYLSTLTDDIPGNVALSDIQMALEWIQQHISSFNGNPDQVTLMGQSGGATLIHALSLSGKAEKLYHRLILQSGTALNPYFLDERPLDTFFSFARYARCPHSQTTEGILSCFRSISTSDLLIHFKGYFERNELRGLQFLNGFKLIVGDNLGYLPQHPASMVTNHSKPMIVGVTKDAGAFIMTRFYGQLIQLRSRNISDYINVVLKHTTNPAHYVLWKQWALEHIFTVEDVRNPSIATLVQKLLELINLILYRGPIIDTTRNTYANSSIYLYSFDYRGEYHRFGHLQNPLPFQVDATLSDENIYLFPYPVEVSQLNANDKLMARTIVDMWVTFATHGAPNLNNGIWPNVSSEYGPYIHFTSVPESKLELDYHFCEGVPVPYLYNQYLNTAKVNNTSMEKTATT